MMKHSIRLRQWAPLVGIAGLLASCTSVPLPPEPPGATVTPPSHPPAAVPNQPPAIGQWARPSVATNDRAYRHDAASHVYGLNAERIWKGRLPPMLYAIGVLEVEVDGRGHVRNLHWMRAPKHAPEVVAEIEKTVRNAAPYPAPVRMGRAKWTDTWLWHASGQFQLDTLTEGQD
jgi:protein TonB